MYTFNFDVSIPEKNEVFVYQDDIFSDEEISIIETYCSKLLPVPAQTHGDSSIVRRCSAAVLEYKEQSNFIYDRIKLASQILNSKFYNFDITGFAEGLQYLQYEASILGHYGAHIDSAPRIAPRKLSVVLFMSNSSEYDGGDLQIIVSDEPISVPKKKGRLVMFPSFRLHRVTPVTAGLRKSIVGWIVGPSFR